MYLKSLEIKLLRKLIYAWDVFFTAVDIAQLKLYIRLKTRLENLTTNLATLNYKLHVTKFGTKKPRVVDSNSIYGKINNIDVKFKISRGAGDGF
jgi:hypothetical protein